MELNERIALVRKAAGLTQEQLGELLGITRQAVGKWESGQSIPDAVTAARLCEVLHVSADYILLGKEPEADTVSAGAESQKQASAFVMPDTCPCCGRPIPQGAGSCPVCSYTPTNASEDDDHHYALRTSWTTFHEDDVSQALSTYCNISKEEAADRIINHGPAILRRGLTKTAVLWLASHLGQDLFALHIVLDDDPAAEDAHLLVQDDAMPLPTPAPRAKSEESLGFGGTVLAVAVGVILALFVLSIF